MDFSDAIGIDYRVVSDSERDGQAIRIVSGAQTFETTIEDMWDAVTSPERIPNWFLPITGTFEPGGRYQLQGHAGGEILKCEPPEFFEITWECGGLSWVAVRFKPDGDGTRMTLEHSMLKDEASESHWKQYGPGATGVGWDLSFVGLGLHLANGGAKIDQTESEAWTASEPGKDFIRESAKRWGEAHIASGEAADTANAMVDQTAKAYTGEQ